VTLYVDAGWVLNVQVEVSPPNTPVADWGALHCMVERHRYERLAAEPYYEETASRAATFLHTALLLEPFSDYNAAIGGACAWEYMLQSEEPITPPKGAIAQLVREIRADKLSLGAIARRLRSWAD
jgi:hypothetical protein